VGQVIQAIGKSDANVGGQTINFGPQSAIVRGVGLIQSAAQIENVLFGVIVWTRRGIESFINTVCLQIAECERPEDVAVIIAESLRQSLSSALNASMDSQTNTPAWVRDAMVKGL
ncbi:MAG: hypothetical protein INR62_04145, partial [Rhodospirillales bacterium]|nr:hypothetical protein [Acetobacter sp.]